MEVVFTNLDKIAVSSRRSTLRLCPFSAETKLEMFFFRGGGWAPNCSERSHQSPRCRKITGRDLR